MGISLSLLDKISTMPFNILVSVETVTEQILESFEEKKIGLELSYFSLPWNLEKDNLKKELKRHQLLLKNFNQDTSLHGAFYGLNPTARDQMLLDVCKFRTQQSIDIATELEMDKIVFHANYIHSNKIGYKDIWIDKQVAFWSQFIPVLEQRGISIFIENTREENASYIATILSKLDHPQIKTCYDTGHSSCFTNSKLHVNKWVKDYGEHLGYIHLHSNDAQQDQHIAFHKGKQDFTGFFDEVQKLETLPHLIVEVKSRESYLETMAELERIGIYTDV